MTKRILSLCAMVLFLFFGTTAFANPSGRFHEFYRMLRIGENGVLMFFLFLISIWISTVLVEGTILFLSKNFLKIKTSLWKIFKTVSLVHLFSLPIIMLDISTTGGIYLIDPLVLWLEGCIVVVETIMYRYIFIKKFHRKPKIPGLLKLILIVFFANLASFLIGNITISVTLFDSIFGRLHHVERYVISYLCLALTFAGGLVFGNILLKKIFHSIQTYWKKQNKSFVLRVVKKVCKYLFLFGIISVTFIVLGGPFATGELEIKGAAVYIPIIVFLFIHMGQYLTKNAPKSSFYTSWNKHRIGELGLLSGIAASFVLRRWEYANMRLFSPSLLYLEIAVIVGVIFLIIYLLKPNISKMKNSRRASLLVGFFLSLIATMVRLPYVTQYYHFWQNNDLDIWITQTRLINRDGLLVIGKILGVLLGVVSIFFLMYIKTLRNKLIFSLPVIVFVLFLPRVSMHIASSPHVPDDMMHPHVQCDCHGVEIDFFNNKGDTSRSILLGHTGIGEKNHNQNRYMLSTCFGISTNCQNISSDDFQMIQEEKEKDETETKNDESVDTTLNTESVPSLTTKDTISSSPTGLINTYYELLDRKKFAQAYAYKTGDTTSLEQYIQTYQNIQNVWVKSIHPQTDNTYLVTVDYQENDIYTRHYVTQKIIADRYLATLSVTTNTSLFVGNEKVVTSKETPSQSNPQRKNIYKEVVRVESGSVYLDGQKIENIDADSLEHVQGYYFKDKNNVWMRIYNWRTSDSSFQEFPTNADVTTFSVIDQGYTKDAYRVYFRGKALPHANPETFIVYYPLSDFGTERSNTYNMYGTDGVNVYMGPHQIQGADVQTFEIVTGGDNGYSKDKNHVYKRSNILWGVKPETFHYDPETKEFYQESKYNGAFTFPDSNISIHFPDIYTIKKRTHEYYDISTYSYELNPGVTYPPIRLMGISLTDYSSSNISLQNLKNGLQKEGCDLSKDSNLSCYEPDVAIVDFTQQQQAIANKTGYHKVYPYFAKIKKSHLQYNYKKLNNREYLVWTADGFPPPAGEKGRTYITFIGDKKLKITFSAIYDTEIQDYDKLFDDYFVENIHIEENNN